MPSPNVSRFSLIRFRFEIFEFQSQPFWFHEVRNGPEDRLWLQQRSPWNELFESAPSAPVPKREHVTLLATAAEETSTKS